MSVSNDPRLLALIEDWIGQGSSDGSPPVIAIAGAQGSGKSTLAAAAAGEFGAAHFSLDDVYLTQAERKALAKTVHPLLATRGVPGTHDLGLAASTVADLKSAGPASRTPLPAFDKLADDRVDPEFWPVFEGRPSAIIIDGWCLGATPLCDEAFFRPSNELEAGRDQMVVWRRYWNSCLAGPYANWFATFDRLLFLRPQSFRVVLDWRCEQEAGLRGLAPGALAHADRERVAGFVAHFERLTRTMMSGCVKADATALLNARRRILNVTW